MFNVVLIETQSSCNRACLHCKHGQGAAPVERMHGDVINEIAWQLRKLEYQGRISPFGINEPLLDPRIRGVVQQFRSACPKAFISLVTNGDRLTIALRDRLFDSGLDGLGISIYEDAVWDRAQQFIHPKVALLDMRGAAFENRAGFLPGFEPRPDLPCLRPSNMLVIRPSGDVVLCCSDMSGEVVMGNVMEQSLMEIWQCEAFERYREQLKSDRHGLKLCEGCSHRGTTSGVRYPLC
jgi:radical SAM protein with 4Fe4S-binding SPASM domain